MSLPKLLKVAVQAVWVHEDDDGNLLEVPTQGAFDARAWRALNPAAWTDEQAEWVATQLEAPTK